MCQTVKLKYEGKDKVPEGNLKYYANKHRNDKKVNLPYCWYKENFSGLDRKSNQTQHSLKPKPGPEQGSNSNQVYKGRERRGRWRKNKKLKIAKVALWCLRKETISIA